MPTFILSLNWTEQGIRSVKDAPKRAEAYKELAKKVGVEIKQVYLTTGEDDLLVIVDAPDGDNVTKFALALGAQVTFAPVLVALGLSPNFKSSYPSFRERVGLKGRPPRSPRGAKGPVRRQGRPTGRASTWRFDARPTMLTELRRGRSPPSCLSSSRPISSSRSNLKTVRLKKILSAALIW